MPSDSGPADASGADAVSIKAMDDRGAIIGFHLLVFMVIVVGLATVVCLSQDWIGGVVIFNYSAISAVPLLICIASTVRRPPRQVMIASAYSIGGLLLLTPLMLVTYLGILVLLFPILHFLVVPVIVAMMPRGPRTGVCAKCGYSVEGLPDAVCPECGEPLTPMQVRVFRTAAEAGGSPHRSALPAGGPPHWLLTADERAAEDSRKDDLRGR